jgi:hypothetical protein
MAKLIARLEDCEQMYQDGLITQGERNAHMAQALTDWMESN